jgi:hypothetical protein
MDELRKGGCACGAVRFEALGAPKFVSNCHCRDCRRATGAAFSTWVGYDTGKVCWQGEPTVHASSATVRRGFCTRCGTPLSYSGKQWAAETHLLIGTFDSPDDLIPTGDVYTTEKLRWTKLVDAMN